MKTLYQERAKLKLLINSRYGGYSDIVNNEEGMKDIIKRFNLINKRIILVGERISKIKRILNG